MNKQLHNFGSDEIGEGLLWASRKEPYHQKGPHGWEKFTIPVWIVASHKNQAPWPAGEAQA